jgi:hypothetical protein
MAGFYQTYSKASHLEVLCHESSDERSSPPETVSFTQASMYVHVKVLVKIPQALVVLNQVLVVFSTLCGVLLLYKSII